jgi:hypothetical protein
MLLLAPAYFKHQKINELMQKNKIDTIYRSLLESIFEDLRRFCDETETTTTKKNQKS